MIEYKKYFENKKITKQGFGVLGRGVGATKFLLLSGARVLVTDTKPAQFFTEGVEDVKQFCELNSIPQEHIEYIFGEHRTQDFENIDMVVQASGVPKDNTYLEYAKSKNIPVYQEGSLFCDIIRKNNETSNTSIKIVGVTGTRGKTTATNIIYSVLVKSFGVNNVHLGGNIQGISTLNLLDKIKEGDYVVMELDSWVLQGFGEIKFSPEMSVFTNFMPDHMNYYKGDMKEYFYDKANIFLYQDKPEAIVMDDKLYQQSKIYLENTDYKNLKPVLIKDEDLKKVKDKIGEISMLGEHNMHNAILAYSACIKLGVPEELALETIRNFTGVAGRLEKRLELKNVTYYNDTCATTGEASCAAISAFKNVSRVVLITGGRDKELDTSFYSQYIIDSYGECLIRNIILLRDESTTGTESLIKYFNSKNFTDYLCVTSIEKAVVEANKLAQISDAVVFSPGFASFGMFNNEYHRGEMFNLALDNLKN